MDVYLHQILKRKKSARKKQDKCLIKVCEKTMNGVKVPLQCYQTDDKNCLRKQISQKKIKKNCSK